MKNSDTVRDQSKHMREERYSVILALDGGLLEGLHDDGDCLTVHLSFDGRKYLDLKLDSRYCYQVLNETDLMERWHALGELSPCRCGVYEVKSSAWGTWLEKQMLHRALPRELQCYMVVLLNFSIEVFAAEAPSIL